MDMTASTSTSALPLFQPLSLGSKKLLHRIALAPCTRLRSDKSDDHYVPSDLMVEYYSQRATEGGILITEATPISKTAFGHPGAAGIHSKDQILKWKQVTDAVHSKGGIIYCQLWHVGRATLAQLIGGYQALSSTSVALKGPSLVPGVDFQDSPPRVMFKSDIDNVVKEFADAARVAIEEAGFDGVEIHGGNGYLLDQFLHDNVNKKTDEYGGSIENRCRFPLEVIKAVIESVGDSSKVGVRLSPYNYYQETKDSNPNQTWSYLCEKIVELDQPLGYVHMVEPRFDEVLTTEDKIKSLEAQCAKKQTFSLNIFRNILKKKGILFIAAGGFDKESAIEKIANGESDIVAFGRKFISNPDLVARFKNGSELNKYDRSTFYGSNPPSKGYTDYPILYS